MGTADTVLAPSKLSKDSFLPWRESLGRYFVTCQNPHANGRHLVSAQYMTVELFYTFMHLLLRKPVFEMCAVLIVSE